MTITASIFIGLTRAAYEDLRARRVVAGGSTISQQTAKLLYSRRERTISRKLGELIKTAALEKSFSKQQILETYLNRIYLGDGAYGVDTAARTYLGCLRPPGQPAAGRHAGGADARAIGFLAPPGSGAAAQAQAARVLQAMADTRAITPAVRRVLRRPSRRAAVVRRLADTHSYTPGMRRRTKRGSWRVTVTRGNWSCKPRWIRACSAGPKPLPPIR